MNTGARWHSSPRSIWLVCLSRRGLILALLLLVPSLGETQVTTNITSSGLNTQIDQVDNSYNITGGTRPGGGQNLFHSFGDFSVGPSDTANFSTLNTPAGTVPIANILGRVTGGNISNIYGTLKTTEFGNANLFLMNPSGIVLGPGASLNVGGSVSFTTAQYIRLFDGVINSANFYTNPANDGLANSILTIDPSAFEFVSASTSPAGYGFLTTPNPTPTITVQGRDLFVPSGQSISLVGGKVVIEGGTNLSAPSGSIKLASAVSPGEFDALTLGSLSNTDGASFTSYGSVSLLSGSSIDVHGTSTVLIKGGQLLLSLKDATLSTADVQPNTISLGSGSSIITSNSGTDSGVDVQLTAPKVNLNGSFISTESQGTERGGNITVTAERLTLDQFAGIFAGTGFGSSSPGGNVVIQGPAGQGGVASSVTLSGLSQIGASTSGSGVGGDITITTTSLDLSGASSILSSTLGDATNGNITVRVQDARLTGASHFSSDTSSSINGLVGGSLTVQGLNGGKAASLLLAGQGSGIRAATPGENQLGNILVKTETLTMMDGALIQSGTPQSFGSAGTITIDAGLVEMTGQSRISSSAFGFDAGPITLKASQFTLDNSTIAADTNSAIGGRGGDVILDVGSASFSNGATVTSSASNTGNAGNITIGARTSVAMTGGSTVTANTDGTGNAGSVTITAPTLRLDQGRIATSTSNAGHAGNITIASGTVTLSSGSTVSSASTGTAPTINIDGTTTPPGRAGTITIAASGNVTSDASTITTSAEANRGGDISIKAGTIQFSNGTLINASTNSPAQVTRLGLDGNGNLVEQVVGDGGAGTITIATEGPASFVRVTEGSSISSSTTAGGNAGQVVMTTPILTMNNATMTTSTSSTGHAGSITAKVGTLTMTNGSVISSSSTGTATGNAGSITIEGATASAKAVTITDSSVLTTAEHTGQGGSISVKATSLALNNATISASVKDINATNPNDGAAIGIGNVTLTGSTIGITDGTISAATTGARNAGTVSLNAGAFAMTNGTITTNTSSRGDAGTISLTATGNGVSLSGGSSITSATTGAGNAGQVVVTTPTLTMDNATITTSTSNTGHAGSITAKVGTLTMTNGSEISSSSTGTATGNAGSLTIQGLASPANTVSLTNSSLLTSAAHTGQGGRISVDTTHLLLDNARVSASVKDVPTNGQPSVGTANIALLTESLTMKNSRMTAESLGSRNAGNILINSPTTLGKRFEMVTSQINTSAALADGGNIEIYMKDRVSLADSTITSSVGNETIRTTLGGNITIDPDFFILKGSEIRANAFAGTGGAIDITSGLFLADAFSLVDASSTLGVSGTVQINSPINNLSSVVARLPESLLAVQALLRASCAARLAQGETSSFVERGRDGIPTGPDGLLASPYLPMTASQSATRGLSASAGGSGVHSRQLFGRGMPSSVTLFSDRATCSP